MIQKQKLHPDGPELSSLSAGMMRLHDWNLSLSEKIAHVEYCLQLGITTFDHADIYGGYGNEELFGEVLKSKPDLRSKMEIVTKCGISLVHENRPENRIKHYNLTEAYISSSVEKSLKNLHTDYLDLLLIHRPDPLMNYTELADTFMKLKVEEKINYAGVSNFTPYQIRALQSKMDIPLITNQVQFSPLHLNPLSDGTFDLAQQLNFSPMIWSPYAGGKVFHDESERSQRVRKTLHELAEKYDAAVDQMIISWIRKHPLKPIVILGTGNRDRIRGAADALEIELERQDWFKLLKASRGVDVP